MSGHTKGQWRAEQIFGKQARINAEGWTGLAKVYTLLANTHPDDECNDTGKANARLIAAAPDMYELLRDFLNNYEFGAAADEKISAVIAKAEGK